jgi:hypothetical protein
MNVTVLPKHNINCCTSFGRAATQTISHARTPKRGGDILASALPSESRGLLCETSSIPSSGKTLPALVGGVAGEVTGKIAGTVGHNYYVLLHINPLVMYIIRMKSRPILKECIMQRYIIIILRSPCSLPCNPPY